MSKDSKKKMVTRGRAVVANMEANSDIEVLADPTNVKGSFSTNKCNLDRESHTGSSTISFIKMTVDYTIAPSSDKTKYIVTLYISLTSDDMAWSSGKSFLTVRCNNKTPEEGSRIKVRLPLTATIETSKSGPYTFSFPSDSVDSINMSVSVDFKYNASSDWGTVCDICGSFNGPGYASSHSAGVNAHMTGMSASKSIDVTSIPLGKPPAKPTLTNNKKYNNPSTGTQNGVSASTNSLTIGVSSSEWGEPDAAKIYWSCNNSGGSGNLNKASQFTISNLKAGTTYTVTVYLQNSMGKSASTTITIRTRHNSPVVSISLDSVDLEQLIFNWSSDKSLKSTEYKIDNGSWTSLGQTGTSGTITAQWFDPKSTHTVYFRGTSIDALDALLSSEKSASGTTHDRGHIVSTGDCIFGLNIDLNIESESDKQLKIDIWTEGNERNPQFSFDNIGTGDFTWTFEPTQEQLDQMYMCYPKSNEIPIHFLLTTHGEHQDWEDTQLDKVLLLTGIAKTAHVGDSSNTPRRCQAWVGDETNTPRRAVIWVGVDDQARRTI